MEEFSLYDEWILEYEKHLGKIDYRESLKEKYHELKNKKMETKWCWLINLKFMDMVWFKELKNRNLV